MQEYPTPLPAATQILVQVGWRNTCGAPPPLTSPASTSRTGWELSHLFPNPISRVLSCSQILFPYPVPIFYSHVLFQYPIPISCSHILFRSPFPSPDPLFSFLFHESSTMSVPFRQLLQEHPTNHARFTGRRTGTDKDWAKRYEPISKLSVHTYVSPGQNGAERVTVADWDTALLPPMLDDQLRLGVSGERPNRRRHRLDSESDMALWFHTEVSNVVLAAWNQHPMVLQTCETKSGQHPADLEVVDVVYSHEFGNNKHPLLVGEFNRNLIDRGEWQAGVCRSQQSKVLSRELRGYAHKYGCTQVFCFDGQTMLLLQFRAAVLDAVREKDCVVDCWVIPRINAGGCTMREALYRLLVQGFRRCQGLCAVPGLTVAGHAPHRELFSGRPVFDDGTGSLSYEHPRNGGDGGFDREVEPNDGSVYWRYNGQPYTENGILVRDTFPMWAAPEN
ncbi:hypothetical protein MAPG_10689 [Magnaporthiopsis poae ATCC 64411]|uniref:Uncharacterized protein n=1 Tax=Magnaporthiopsis poae (strain ATCC 64411 / 73-15) TaxID=644358 RepID=A0A0C4ED95_MAGP6|nr:hypothetical protein MAPG_10689 [Magnaporthiopsis poae ATCC 64411]